MKIKIQEREYEIKLTGTVGLVYLAERILGEPFDAENKYHLLVLYYSAFKSSNRTAKELPDLVDFIAAMTVSQLNALASWFWQEWNRLDPQAASQTEDSGNP